MAIEFKCPHCGMHYMLKDEFAGKQATCKNAECKKAFLIPAPRDRSEGTFDKPKE